MMGTARRPTDLLSPSGVLFTLFTPGWLSNELVCVRVRTYILLAASQVKEPFEKTHHSTSTTGCEAEYDRQFAAALQSRNLFASSSTILTTAK